MHTFTTRGRAPMAFAAIWIASAWPAAALACASCQCGDPTLTLMGVEKSYAGRLRFALDYSNRSEHQGTGLERQHLQEDRTVFGASYAFSENFSLALRVPLSSKSASNRTLAREEASGLGDAELTAKYTLGRSGQMTARHLWGVQAGLRLPTASEQKNDAGEPIDIDAQPGTGAWAASAGLWYGYFRFPRMLYASLSVLEPLDTGYQGLEQGTAVLGTVTGQYALTPRWSLQLGLEGRIADYNRFGGVRDDDSGGTAMFVAPGLVWAPATDWLVHVSGQLPVIRNLHGDQDERGDLRVGIAYDFSTN
ncbi:hypothetical protein AAG565_05830 [Fontimonas sp. SYSU GA230001]|uniref:hypothetical protein n=1 Tax=Fontimonas sp. SYSU GA230001 TaxID=3142450 RepID=UPI0032B55A04